MSAFVVDTNVPAVANGRSEQASPDCVLACIDALDRIINGSMIVIDQGLLILMEYMQCLNMSGQPGPGDSFMKWAWTIQAMEEHCEYVSITPDTRGRFEEFPADAELEAFDRSDTKFVAVAAASKNEPTILNAVDSDWAHHYHALTRNGIKITFLCPQHVRPR